MAPTNNDQFKLDKLFDVQGKVAVITGGGSGIGLMCCQALATNGAKVYIVGRTMEKLQAVVDHYGKDISGSIHAIQGDISKKESVKEIYEKIAAQEKCVCILINNAGINGESFSTEAKSAEEMKKNMFDDENATYEEWCDLYRTNVPQCFFMTMCFLPLLQAASEHQQGYSGCVVNICSISGIVKTMQHHPAYNATKAAVIHLTKMLAFEIANNGLKVRVSSIAPGVFPSEMTSSEESDMPRKNVIQKDKFEGKVPAGRPGNDRDFGNAILFAVTNQYLNGQCIPIDGGYIIQHGSA